MNHSAIRTLSLVRKGGLFPEEKDQYYRKKIRKAGQSRDGTHERTLFLPPPPPDKETIERLNKLAGQSPFCTSHRYRNNNLL